MEKVQLIEDQVMLVLRFIELKVLREKFQVQIQDYRNQQSELIKAFFFFEAKF